MKARIGILLLAAVVVTGCALHPHRRQAAPGYSASLDSARTLIRRGMVSEAQAILSEPRKFSDNKEYVECAVLAAKCFELQEKWSVAAGNYRALATSYSDSTRFRVAYWKDLAAWWGQDSTKKDSLQAEIRRFGDSYAEGTKLNELYLAYMAAAFVGDSSAEARGDKLCTEYPTCDEANEIIGGKFWDGLYPIWENDSAKVPYMQNFIQKYSRSDWALYARRNLIGSHLALKDTVNAMVEAFKLAEECKDDNPLILSQLAGTFFDFPSLSKTVQIWAERADSIKHKLHRPSYYSPPEWALVEQVTKANFPLTLAAVRLKEATPPTPPSIEGGERRQSPLSIEGGVASLELARRYAEESLALATYDLDDNNTPAPQYLMLGRIALAMGDSAKAADYWVKTAIEGDVYNRFAGRAVDSLKGLIGLTTKNTKDTERELLRYCRTVADYHGITFDRVTAEVGLDSARGGRVAWGDYDDDGDDDVLAGGSRLYQNADADAKSEFRDVTARSRLGADGCHGGIWANFDNNGRLDLFGFSSSSDAKNSEKLFRSVESRAVPNPFGSVDSYPKPVYLPSGLLAEDTFWVNGLRDVTSFSPSLPDSFSTEAAIWFDANGDGLLDLYIPGYERPAKGADDLGNAWPSRLMVQGADGAFRDSTEAFGIGPEKGRWLCGRSPVACDFDRDGDQDLYVGNYRLQENQFWVNGGNGQRITDNGIQAKPKSEIRNPQFTNMAAYYGVDGEEVEGWWGHTIGCEWGDFDGDGDFDLIACNLAHPRYIGFSNRTMLYRNDGDVMEKGKGKREVGRATPPTPPSIEGGKLKPPFVNVRKEWGIKYEECHSEPCWGDFDNDGDLDLFITCVYPNRRSFLYENKGDHFEDVTFLSGVRIFNGWGCATSDYDDDGRLDLAACEEGKIELFRNTTKNENNWIEIAPDRRPGVHLSQIGGIVEIEAGGRKIIRQFEGGKGAGSQNSGTLHFGIGKATVCKMTVSNYGRSEKFEGLRANQRFEIGKETVGVGVR